MDLSFLPERKRLEKVENLIANTHDKTEYVTHIKSFIKVHRSISFNQSEWLKPYIEMNNELRQKATNDFEKDFFKLMHKSVFGNTMGNVRNYKDIKLVESDRRRSYLVSGTNVDTTSKNLLAIEIKKLR